MADEKPPRAITLEPIENGVLVIVQRGLARATHCFPDHHKAIAFVRDLLGGDA